MRIVGEAKGPVGGQSQHPQTSESKAQKKAPVEGCNCVEGKSKAKVVTDREEMIANCSSPPSFKGPSVRKIDKVPLYDNIMPILNKVACLDAIEK